jgi:hypothetical protein
VDSRLAVHQYLPGPRGINGKIVEFWSAVHIILIWKGIIERLLVWEEERNQLAAAVSSSDGSGEGQKPVCHCLVLFPESIRVADM